jgi:hypothetical protein
VLGNYTFLTSRASVLRTNVYAGLKRSFLIRRALAVPGWTEDEADGENVTISLEDCYIFAAQQESFVVRGSSRSAICLSQDDRLVKTALGCQNPAAADESCRLENATEFLP